ncbi:hypothetical protein AB0M32_09815 [Streptomyces sp. NPDC051985]
MEIIHWKGTGQLKGAITAFLGQRHIKKLYDRWRPTRSTRARS